MPRSKSATPPFSDQHHGLLAVHVILPGAIYFVDDAQRLLRLRSSTIRREVRERRLRISKRAGRYFILGEWLLAWIKAGEIGVQGDH
jgi:hypothetical protein